MIAEIENCLSPRAVPSASVARVKVHQLHLGDQRVALLADAANKPIALCANRLTVELERVIERMDFAGPAGQCVALEISLQCGYCIAGYAAAEWLSGEAKTLMTLRPHLANALREGVALPSMSDCPVDREWREFKCN